MKSLTSRIRTGLGLIVAAGLAVLVQVVPADAQNKCGAIAFSQQTGRTGWSYNFQNRPAAEAAALAECAKEAGDCTVPLWFCNACGAIAVTPNRGFGTGWGTTRALAEQYALQSCRQHNPGGGCAVSRWVCTDR